VPALQVMLRRFFPRHSSSIQEDGAMRRTFDRLFAGYLGAACCGTALLLGSALPGTAAVAADSASVSTEQHGKASDKRADQASDKGSDKGADKTPEHFKEELQGSDGSVVIGGRRIDYRAVAGTLVVHLKGWDDVPQNADKDDKNPAPEASMFYVAYLARNPDGAPRPITFLYNGGPGSSTVWLHMGAFGPKRVVTADDTHTPAAPYTVIGNAYSLLDASDLVFIDAPGTGFSRVSGKDKEKAFYGIDADAQAFADFIYQFLSKNGRWNSPKFLFGESYGTIRDMALISVLETEKFIDVNGVINLSEAALWEALPDGTDINPGVELPYELSLPTFAATAWYHHRLPDAPKDLGSLLPSVEHFALTDYATALLAGNRLDPAQRQAVAQKLHEYTGLPLDYINKANLRITGGEFEKTLESDADVTVGRLDTRFSGPTMDPLSKEADYDPQEAAISSAYVSAFNHYVRSDLKFMPDRAFRPLQDDINKIWNFQHQPPGAPMPLPISSNVLPDLAVAMKYNPKLRVMLNAGYYDLATPYFEGVYEMSHLPIPAKLQANIEYHFYESGHMVYAHEPSLKALHDNAADFIRRASAAGGN
jgi:carboxypeptidase C (cathepsin A)